jgi:phytoene dehydrogenase-like protein
MSEADAVVIGGGHNGLALATALGRSGLSVVVVEAERLPGGMARTDDMLGAGHVHHPHATFLGYHGVMPLRADLRRAGLRWLVPEAQHAIVFADGRPGMVIHRRDRLDRTRLSVGRYSSADASLLVTVLSRAAGLKAAMAEFLTSVPSRAAAERYVAAIRRAYAALPVLGRLGSRSVAELIRESFGAPEVRAFLLMLAHELGGDITATGGGHRVPGRGLRPDRRSRRPRRRHGFGRRGVPGRRAARRRRYPVWLRGRPHHRLGLERRGSGDGARS